MECCSNLEKCGFMAKYSKNKALAVRGFILLYCKGEMQGECARKIYRELQGTSPSDDMMPSGAYVTSRTS